MCPRLLKRLWKLIKIVWRKGVVPRGWQLAEGCFVPKEESAEGLHQFRSISLLSVEGKMYFSPLSKQISQFLLENHYIDTSVQKGGIPQSSGCLEHTGVISQLLKEAKEDRRNISRMVGLGECFWISASQTGAGNTQTVLYTRKDQEHHQEIL